MHFSQKSSLFTASVFFLIFNLFLPPLYGQSHLPAYRFVHKPEKLAPRITAGLSSDSARALAIHDWLTHHIKYDVKKFSRNDLDEVSTKKLLRRRKAICSGYSDLFDSLCKYAGLKSVTVSGYTKNIDVDIEDTFYLDDHSWNAVLVNGQWLLNDACWDAGYIYYKKTFFQALAEVLSMGHAHHYKTKPRFKREPVNTYCMKNGSAFIMDHLAVVPLWQLLNKPLSIEQFREDSSYYYKRTPKADTLALNDGLKGQRLAFYELPPYLKYAYWGKPSLDFNQRNHYYFANSKLLKAAELTGVIDASGGSTMSPKALDTALAALGEASRQFDTNAVYIGLQKGSLLRNNKAKMDLFRSYNSSLASSSKNVLRQAKKGGKQCTKSSARLKKLAKSNNDFIRKAWKIPAFYLAKMPKETNKEDSAGIRKELTAINDSLHGQDLLLNGLYERADSISATMINHNRQFLQMSAFCSKAGKVLGKVRAARFDDYDYEIKYIRDTLLMLKLPNDSLLFSAEGKFLAAALYDNVQRQYSEPPTHQQQTATASKAEKSEYLR